MNILFDPPEYDDVPTDFGEVQSAVHLLDLAGNPEDFFDLKSINKLLLLFLILLVVQYLCIFMSVPCDEVINRPLICIISSFIDGIMVRCTKEI